MKKFLIKIKRITDNISIHLISNLFIILLSTIFSSILFCIIFLGSDFSQMLIILLLISIPLIFAIIATGLIFYHELYIYNNLLDLSASFNIKKTIMQKIPSFKALFDSAIFTASFFHKVLSKIIVTGNSLQDESDKLQKISMDLYNTSRFQQNSINHILVSSQKIDDLLFNINSNITDIEHGTSQTLNTSSVIEDNSSEIHTLLDDLISFIHNAKDIIKRSEISFKHSNAIVEGVDNFIENTNISMEELKSISHNIHKNILSTLNFQHDVFKKVQLSQKIIDEYSLSISSIKDNLNTTIDIIELLKSHSEEINNTLEFINKISKQTNLLSLNANIIAASSGEDSKKFTVVADEIHSLSKKTIKSTAEIAQIVANISKSIVNSSDASQESISIVNQTQYYGKQVNKNLKLILANAKNSINNVNIIKNANAIQTNKIEQVLEKSKLSTKNIAELSNYNHRLQKDFEQLKEVAVQLIDITNGLKGRMSLQLNHTKSLINNTNNVGTMVNKIIDIATNIKVQSNSILKSFGNINQVSDQSLFTVRELTNLSYQIHNEYNRTRSLTEYFIPFTPIKGGSLRIFFPPFTDKFSYDPFHCNLIESVPLFNSIYETLVETISGFSIKPLLCEKFEISNDHKEYIFYLKNNVYFHNNKQLIAEDIKFSYERLRDMLRENAEEFIGAIEGYEEFAENKTEELKGIEIIDDLTIRIVLKYPLAYFLHILSTVVMSIVPKSNKKIIKEPIGTGAFKLNKQVDNKIIILDRFDNYHIDGLPFVDQVKFISKEKQDYFKAEYHIVPGHQMPVKNIFSDINILVNTKTEMHSEILDPNSVSYILLNTKIHPFDIKEVRQAVQFSIDRDKMVDTVFNRINKKAECIIPQNLLSHYPRKDIVRYDINTAKDLIEKAKISLPMTLSYYTTLERFKDPAIDFVLQNISKLGIHIEYKTVKPQDHITMKYESAMTQLIWFADYPDPDNFFSTFASEDIDNRGIGWVNEKYIDLIHKARIEIDLQKRQLLYNKAEEILLDEAVIIPLYYNKYLLFHHYDIICPVKPVFPFYDIKNCCFYNSAKNK